MSFSAEVEQRITELLSKMTLSEKVSLLSGVDNWRTAALPHLGIDSLVVTDGPHGVRANQPEAGRISGATTFFPTGVSMAASWNPTLVEQIGVALGEETRAMGCDVLLGPCINIIRDPRAGRNFESMSEDPCLAGRIGIAYVKGVQSQGVGTSLKHFACNNYEFERGRASSNVDERTLREIYLPAFEAVVKEAHPWTLMCSYNRINGVYACENRHLLREILKDEWGFDGLVVSDWNANHSTVDSLVGGLDLEMPGPVKYYGRLLTDAIYEWRIEEAVITESAHRILRTLFLAGKLSLSDAPAPGAVNTHGHQQAARVLAEESITLLKNVGDLLPLDVTQIKTLAVIGPNAAVAVSGSGSSRVEGPYRISPLEGLKAALGGMMAVEYEPGCDNLTDIPTLSPAWLQTPQGQPGLRGEYFDNVHWQGQPDLVRTDPQPELWGFASGPAENIANNHFSARWTGQVTLPESGQYRLKLSCTGRCRVYWDGAVLFDNVGPTALNFDSAWSSSEIATKEFAAGEVHQLKVEFAQHPGQDFAHWRLALGRSYRPGEDGRLTRAIALAARADAVVVCVGMPEGYESEGFDRPNMELPGGQNELIRAVAQANPRTVVILNTGVAVTMPWLDEVPALLEAYYPGQENGHALANILLGVVNPSGKLPMTFAKRLEDVPGYLSLAYHGVREVTYGEGVFVGYRGFDQRALEPLFPFGFGLSYTTFAYGNIQAPAEAKAGETVTVQVTVQNTGVRAGQEVVQVYVHDRQASLPRPPRELKAFAKVALEPGQAQTLSFALDARAFAFYDAHKQQWVVEPGEFEIQIGSSSRHIHASALVKLG